MFHIPLKDALWQIYYPILGERLQEYSTIINSLYYRHTAEKIDTQNMLQVFLVNII